MAYTFEELALWWPQNRYPISNWTLVRTQEDGRTGYSHGVGNGYDPAKQRFMGQFSEQFNDRRRALVYAPPAPSAGSYQQNSTSMLRSTGRASSSFVQLPESSNLS